MMHSVWLLVPIAALFSFSLEANANKTGESVTSNNNTLLVDFAPDIPEGSQAGILLAAKELFSNASLVLQKSIELSFRTVVFVIPNSWDVIDPEVLRTLGNVENANSFERLTTPQVSIVSSSAFKQPVSIQYGGCEQQGRRITIPSQYLHNNDSRDGKRFAKEWIKFRYGVFDENGFPEDSRFPEYYRILGEDSIEITKCSDAQLNYTSKDADGKNCVLSVNQSSGLPLPDATCGFRIDLDNNAKVQSSLLDGNIYTLTNVDAVCDNDQHQHDKDSPNKQNVLCQGRSIREIVRQHPDYEAQKNIFADQQCPTFRIVKKQNLRVVLAVDDTRSMKKYEYLLKNAIKTFIFSLPKRTEYGFIPFMKNVSSDSIMTLSAMDEDSQKIEAATATQFIFRKEEAKPELAIKKAIEELVPSDVFQSGTIILISSSVPYELENQEALLSQKLEHLCLIAIFFNQTLKNEFDTLSKRIKFLKCSESFYIPGDNFASLQHMTESLNSIFDKETTEHHMPVKAAKLEDENTLSFIVDDNVDYFDMILTSQEPTVHVRPRDITLEGNDEIYCYDAFSIVYNGGDLMVLRMQNETHCSTTWTLKTQFPLDDPLLVQVIANQNNLSNLKSPRLKIWMESEKTNSGNYQEPIIMYAEVLSETYPVINAKVLATITAPNETEHYIELYDNGIGDPDITKNDGIYSRYFIQFSAMGDYKVKITANDSSGEAKIGRTLDVDFCCGSEIFWNLPNSSKTFSKEATASFKMTKRLPETGYEPSQIQDLKVLEAGKPFNYIIQWTAPGKTKDFGIAEHYQLKIFDNREHAYKFEDENRTIPFNLSSEGKQDTSRPIENHQVDLTGVSPLNISYYMALVAENTNGKRGKVSNIVRILLVEEQVTETTTTNPITPFSEGEKIGIAVGSLVLIVCLFAAAFVTFFYCFKNKENKKKKDVESQPKLQASTVPNPSDGNITNVKRNQWNNDSEPISPVTSVPAKVLLYHHEQVKDAKTKNKEPPLFSLQSLNNEMSNDEPRNVPNGNASDCDSQISDYDQPNNNSRYNYPAKESVDNSPKPETLYTAPHKKMQTNV